MSNIFRGLWNELCGRKTPPIQIILWGLPVGLLLALGAFFLALFTAVPISHAPRQAPVIMSVMSIADQPDLQLPVQRVEPKMAPATFVAAAPAPVASLMVEHPVQSGQTLIGILKKYCRQNDYREIAQENGINPDRIYADKTVLRFQNGCAANANAPAVAVKRQEVPVVRSSLKAAPHIIAPRLGQSNPQVISQPTLRGEVCAGGLARGFVGTGRARRSMTQQETLRCIGLLYGAYIREASGLTGLPIDLLVAKVFVESRGDPDAVNRRDGSSGLSQLQPATARQYGLSAEHLFAPRENILCGARILADYVRMANGDIARGLAYYNAGPYKSFLRHAGFDPQKFPFVLRIARVRALLTQTNV